LRKNGCSAPNIDVDAKNNLEKQKQYGIDWQADCPGFDGLYTFSQLSTGKLIIKIIYFINFGGINQLKKMKVSLKLKVENKFLFPS